MPYHSVIPPPLCPDHNNYLHLLTLQQIKEQWYFTGSGETPTLETVDSYMKKLHSIIVSNPQDHETLVNTVRDVVNRLDR